MMNRKEFYEYVKDNVKDYLPDSYQNGEIRIEEVVKNRVDYLCENTSVKYGVYTDDEDVTYNHLVFNKESEL